MMQLTCHLTLSREAEGAEAEAVIKRLVDKANRELLLKGAPPGRSEEAAQIVSWTVKGRTLSIQVRSGSHVRAPSAVIRFRKALAQELGSKLKVGIRGLEVSDLVVEVSAEVSQQSLEKIRGLPHIKDAYGKDGKLILRFKTLTETELKDNLPDRVVSLARRLAEEKVEARLEEVHPVVRQGVPRRLAFRGDPVELGVELGWFKEFPGRGQWIYTTPYAMLSEVIEQLLMENVVKKLGFQPFMLPKLIPLAVMKRMPGYLEGIPEGMYYVCPPPRDPEAFTEFKETVKVTKRIPKELLKRILKEPEYVLAPAQCEPFWQFFSHETLRLEDLPIKLYDRSGWTYRWEGGGVEGLVRIQEFRRIELVYLGSPEQVVEIRDAVRDSVVDVVDKLLELDWRIVAAAPFYMKEGEIGDIQDSRNVAAFDVEVYLPYRGERKKAEWLEIAGCFVHKDKFVKSFSLHEAKNRPLWTGCTGLGISRWTAAFLASYGFNPENWPETVRKRFGAYKLPKTLLWPKKTST
jgi:seryl-tRNA synthetase